MSLVDISRRSIWHSLRIQIVGSLLVTLPPFLIGLVNEGDIQILVSTLIGCVFAASFGIFLFRGVSTYPGAESSSYILPSFTLAYSMMFGFFLILRLPYSLLVIFGSAILMVVWMYIIYFKIQRARDLNIGIIGDISPATLRELDGVNWIAIEKPSASVGGLAAVAVDLRANLPDEWERKLADYALGGLPVYHIKHLYESLTGKVELERMSENSFGSLSPLSAFMMLKHGLDWITALIAMIVLSPLFFAVVIMIRLDSPGPALFRQIRIGYRGRPFTVFKFRTMRVEKIAPNQTLRAAITQEKDARITRLGSLLRKTRIDELPQLLNILRLEMSWIGPRPEAQILSEWYEREIPFYRYRHIVRPGITGWAQVNQGHVAEISDVISKLHYDFYYVKHFSPWIDLLIVARTIRTVVTGYGAR